HLFLFLTYGVAGVVIALVGAYIAWNVGKRPDLRPWHRLELEEEFKAGDAGRVPDFEAYKKLEDRLFAHLRRSLYEGARASEKEPLNRYSAGSLADPGGRAVDWNRSFEMPASSPRAAVLVVHGLSDSPYIMRGIAERLHARGAWVLG